MGGGDAISAEVIVAGAGLVGPALALALARSGFDVVLVDRLAEAVRADPAFDGRAYAIALGSAGCLGALGLWSALEEKAQPIRDITVSEGAPAGEGTGAADLHFDPRALDEARVGWILEDRFLRAALLEAVAAEAGIRHLAPAEIAHAAFEPGRAVLTLADGRQLTAPLAIAADGRGSALAQMAGIGRQVLRYGQTGLVAAIAHEKPHEGRAHQSFFSGGPFAVLPLPENRSGLVWSEQAGEAKRLMALDDAGYEAALGARIGPRLGRLRLAAPRRAFPLALELADAYAAPRLALAGEAKRLMALDDAGYEAALGARIGPRLGRLRLAAPRRAFPLALELADAYAAPRLALAGDAAHGVHPIAGQGLNMGLRDVAALTEVLADAARRGEDIGDLGVLRRYERWRRFDNAALALGMDGLARLFSNANPVLSALRRVGLRTVNKVPAATRFFMREAAGLSGTRPAMMTGRLP
ncbi:MAG: FAD-dependent monooxygenase [Pseudomonadota bacterium]